MKMKKIGCALLIGLVIAMGLSAEPNYRKKGFKTSAEHKASVRQKSSTAETTKDNKQNALKAAEAKKAAATTPAEKNEADATSRALIAEIADLTQLMADYMKEIAESEDE
jgi:hypothetical protein